MAAALPFGAPGDGAEDPGPGAATDHRGALHRIRILGPLSLEVAGREVPLGGLRQRAVLAVLLINANEVVSRDSLIDQLWADSPPASAVSTLQGYISHLRRALRGSPFELASRTPGYVLEIDPALVDAFEFLTLIEQAGRALGEGRAAATHELLDGALALWRGPALAEFVFEDFARAEATRLEEARLAAMSLRTEAALALGQHQAVVPQLEQLVLDHPLREDFRAQLMRALAAGGRRAEALRVYQDGRRAFAEELGLEPSLSLQRLEAAILAQEGGPDAATASPAAGPAGAPGPTRLPAATTSFVGRREELGQLGELVESRRLVTVTGPGGIGKTRLTVEVMRGLAPAHPDGVFMVELAGLSDGSLVAPAVAAALGLTPQPDRPVLDTISQAVAHRHLVVVLDNCEHLLAPAAEVAATLLRSGEGVRVVATSRQPLGVAGESVWPVPTLGLPSDSGDPAPDAVLASEAACLFIERADTADPGFRLTAANAGAVAQICRRLDGIPLALELAAARLRSMGIEQLAERLDDRFRLLTTGDRTALPRYQTLAASVEWSHDLLDDRERRAFRRLSVFSGAFDLGGAEAVCAGPDVEAADAVALCGDLVDRSLLTRVSGPRGEPRYRMLETLRQFGASRLAESGEEPEVRAVHARVFAQRAEAAVGRLHSRDGAVWVTQIDADSSDLRSALEWLVTHGDAVLGVHLATCLWLYWRYRDEPAEGRAWLRRALARAEATGAGPDPGGRLAAMVAEARLALVAYDSAGALEACEQGMALLGPDEGWSRAQLLAVQAEVLRFEGNDPARAEELAAEAVEGFHRQSDPYWEGHARRVLCQLAWDRGALTRATVLAGQCLSLWEQCGDAEGIAGARLMLAGLARDRGDLTRAAALYEESLEAFRAIGQPWGQAEAARHVGTLALGAGDHERALALGAESLRLCEELGIPRGVGLSYELLGRAAFAAGDLRTARTSAERALDALREGGYRGDVAGVAATAGHVALHEGDLERAADHLEEALGPPGGFGYHRTRASSLGLLARVRARRGDPAAVTLALEAVALGRDAGDIRATAAGIEALAEGTVVAGDPKRAARLLLVARYTRDATGTVPTRVEEVDHTTTLAAVESSLAPGPFAERFSALAREELVALEALEAVGADPDALLGEVPSTWEGPERRRADRRRGERRDRAEDEVGVSASADRRRSDRRRWQRRRSDRLPFGRG